MPVTGSRSPPGKAPRPSRVRPCPRPPPHPRTSSQFCNSFTQNLARWKLLLSVRSGGERSGSVPLHPHSPPVPAPAAPSPSRPYRSRRRRPAPRGSKCGSWPRSAPSQPCPAGGREALSRCGVWVGPYRGPRTGRVGDTGRGRDITTPRLPRSPGSPSAPPRTSPWPRRRRRWSGRDAGGAVGAGPGGRMGWGGGCRPGAR